VRFNERGPQGLIDGKAPYGIAISELKADGK
jgi:hypothetical protein